MGGALLRDEALSDPRVIALINERLVPVWVNIRSQPVPDLLDAASMDLAIDARRHINTDFSRHFLVRSAVVTSDGKLLNPQHCQGGLPITKADPYLDMLRAALF